MAIGTDRYASRGDTLLFIACVGLSIAALSLPDQWRDPLAQGLRQSVLAPFLFLQRQTELLAAARYRYDAVVAQRDSSALAATFLPELRSENTRLRSLLGLSARLGSVVGIAAPHGAEGPSVWLLELQGVLYRQQVPAGTVIVTSGLGGVFPRGIPIGVVIGPAGEEKGWGRTYLVRPVIHPAELSHVMILTSSRPAGSDLRNAFTVPQDSALPRETPPQ